ncbi:MAG: ribbon-helix-helix protein, CopG family [Chitinispirillales bacterium]|jgi:metal-responsive CopG/Arc/MetJ family transcriptional regulator|nr:ribbon-helix-helix protein, CopG family [Chitinispirillales bacterium]
MAVLTLNISCKDETLRGIDEFAEIEERSREELVNEAVEVYLRRKRWDRVFTDGSDLATRYGITEGDVNEAILEVREEKKRGEK